VTPITLSQSQAATFLGYSVSAFRRLVVEGSLPGPIDPALRPKLRRWSRPMLERYVTPPVEADPTPAHGIARPELRSVAS